jgi:cytochrome c2
LSTLWPARLWLPNVAPLVVAALALVGCQPPEPAGASKPAESKPPAAAPGSTGDAATGKQLFVTKGCAACHKAPGVPEATGIVGPDLRGIGNPSARPKIAVATVDNTPENMKRWIMDPSSVRSGTSMPNLGLSEAEATDLIAFMETLK